METGGGGGGGRVRYREGDKKIGGLGGGRQEVKEELKRRKENMKRCLSFILY